MRNGLVSSAPRQVAVLPSLGVLLLFAGCTAEIVIIPPPTQVVVSQGLPPLQQAGPELSKPKPKTRSIVVKQGVPSLGQKSGGTVQGEFSPEFNKEFN
jgi:hypothetical protein